MSIYDDVKAAQQIIEEYCDLTTGEVLDEAQMKMAQELKNSVLNLGLETLCKIRANKMADIEAMKAEEKRISDRRKVQENSLAKLNDYIYMLYQQGDDVVQHAGTFTLSTHRSTQVLVDEENFSDNRFIITSEVKKIDKKALGEALKQGAIIEGARLQTNYNLQVR